jgi:hypothetical protein
MIKEDYVSFETAKLLKEKGFDEECSCFYNNIDYGTPGLEVDGQLYYKNSALDDLEYATPTLQMAMKWLREIYSLEIYPYHDFPKVGNKWWLEIIKYPNSVSEYESETAYNTYEEACEAAIKYCLENLI